MRGVLDELGAGHERGDRGMRLHRGDDVLGAALGRREVIELEDAADRERVEVRVEEATAGDLARRSQHLDVAALATSEVEPRLELGAVEGEHLFDPQGHVVPREGGVEPRLSREERVHAVARDDEGAREVTVGPVRRDADDLAGVDA